MNLISIDPSLRSTGVYCRTIGAAEETEWAETIKTTAKYRPSALVEIFGSLRLILHHHTFDVALIEGYSFASRSSSASALGEVGGTIRVALQLEHIPIIEIAPAMWKSIARAQNVTLPKTKTAAYVKAVNSIYGVQWETSDECDAYMMALAASRIYKGLCYKTEANRRVLKALVAAMEKERPLFNNSASEGVGNTTSQGAQNGG